MWFSQVPLDKFLDSTSDLAMTSFAKFPLHYSIIILPFDSLFFEIGLNEPQINTYISKPKHEAAYFLEYCFHFWILCLGPSRINAFLVPFQLFRTVCFLLC